MKSKAISLGLAAVVIASATSLLNNPRSVRAQSQKPLSLPQQGAIVRPGPGCCAKGVAPRELDFPYYSLKDGYQATLLLVSDSPQPVDLTIAIRDSAGQMLTTTATLQPQAKLPFDVAATITNLGGDPAGAYAEGSIAVYYLGTMMPVVGQITETNPALGLTHQVDMVENDPGRSDIPPVLNGIWWGLGGGRTATVTVTNSSDTPQFANIYLDFEGMRHAVTAPLSFAPYETKALDVGQLLTSVGASAAGVPQGGITIQQIGPNPALMASGKITDPATGFSSGIDFPEPERQRASALHATGLPVGTPTKDSPYAGAGTFIPHVVVRNLSGASQNVTITLEYPEASTSASAAPASGVAGSSSKAPSTGHNEATSARARLPGGAGNHPEWGAGTGAAIAAGTTLGSMPVAAYSTADFSLAAMMSQLPLPLPFCSIRIQYSGAPGSVEAQVSSVEENDNLIVDAPPQNEGDGWAGSGANPWHIDNNTESVLFLTDMGDKPARIAFEVTANGIHYYLTQLVLQPHETRAINLRALRDAQTPDLKGNKIPAAATDGSVNWIRADLAPVTGRVVVINRHDGTASSFDCCTGNCPSSDESMWFSNAPATIDVGSSNLQLAPVIYDEDCNYNAYYIDGGYNDCTWNDSDTTVATVDATGWVTGVAGGVTTITMYANGMQYDCSSNMCTQTPVQLDASGGTTVTINVQITSTTLSGSTINAYTNPTSVTLTVNVQYQAVSANASPSPSVTLEVGSASGTPAGNTVTYSPTQYTLSFSGPASYVSKTFQISGATQNGTVLIQASLASPSAGVTIVAPSPATNAQATINTTTN